MKRSYTFILFIPIAATLGSLFLLGCGSNGTTSSLSKTELTREVNQICKKRLLEKDRIVANALEDFSTAGSSQPSHEEVEEVAQSLMPPFQHISEEIGELSTSDESAESIEKIIAKLEAGLKDAEADPHRLAESDPFEAAGEFAQAHGFKDCAL